MHFLKYKTIKIITSGLFVLTSSASLVVALALDNNSNNTSKIDEKIIIGQFSAMPLSKIKIEVDYNLDGNGVTIGDLEKIEYTFDPTDTSHPTVTHTQKDDFPPSFNSQSIYEIENQDFSPGETYIGKAKIFTKNNVPYEEQFSTPIKMPAGDPIWNDVDSKVEGKISGAEIYANIKGVVKSPAVIFDSNNFNVKISEKSSGGIFIKEENLSNLAWIQDASSNWKLRTPIRIEDGLKDNTEYVAQYYFKGDGENISSNIEGYYSTDFSTSAKITTPQWTVTQISLPPQYDTVDINIKSENVYDDWHESLLKKVSIENIKNIKTDDELNINEYKHINKDLSSWKPSKQTRTYDRNWKISNLEPESEYKGNLVIDYKQDIVVNQKLKVPFDFNTKNKKTAPIISVEDTKPVQKEANGWEVKPKVKIVKNPSLPSDREGATYEDVNDITTTLTEKDGTIFETIKIKVPEEENQISFGKVGKWLKADTTYQIKIEVEMNDISLKPDDVSQDIIVPKNVGFEKPTITANAKPQKNNSMEFDIKWDKPFNKYETNISKMSYSIDNENNWNEVSADESNNYTNLFIDNLDPITIYDVYLKIAPKKNTAPGPEKDGNYIWSVTDTTDKNPAPKITIAEQKIYQEKVEFKLNIIDSQYLTKIKIETTDVTKGNLLLSLEINESEICEDMTLEIDSKIGIVDFNEYKFKITFEVDSNKTYLPGEAGKNPIKSDSVGGSSNNNKWTSETIKTYPKEMKISNIQEKNRIVSKEYGLILEISYDISNIKGYMEANFIIKNKEGNQVRKIYSTNPISEGVNERTIGNLELGYTLIIELWGKETDSSMSKKYMHTSTSITIEKI